MLTISRLLLASVSVVIEDEGGLFKLPREMKVLLDRLNPGLSTRFNINSILTLVVD